MLTSGELDRVRVELGYNVLNVGAEPYIGVHAVFSQVIQPYLREGLETTSSTAVVAAPAGAAVQLTLASATGITLRTRLAIDVDDSLEVATVRAISGSNVVVILRRAHAGTYPVAVDAGLQFVRECLSALYKTQLLIDDLDGTGALKKVDEVEFYDCRGKSRLQLLTDQQEHWRNRLASALGIPRLNIGHASGGSCSLY